MTIISIKNNNEINKMRLSGKLVADVLEMIENYIVPGVTTQKINDICHNYIINKQHAQPACLNYQGFPKSICISKNNIVCHGIPNKNEILQNGDIVNIDIAIVKNQYYSDASKMFFVGKPTLLSQKLCHVAKKSLYLALNKIKSGIYLHNISETIQNYVEKNNFSIVKEYCGHGIGKNFHEPPHILHHTYYKNEKIILKSGMTFTIEPMINVGSSKVTCMNDGWTVKTADNSLSAQYEHTILVNKAGCEILTLQKGENIPKILNNKN
ncbi:MAG: type I methionyl aminopeptidase [Buchnera aphidicola (Chaetogeoica yunlongensis)]